MSALGQAGAEPARATNLAALVATHNLALVERMDRRVTILEGRIADMA